MNRADAAKKLLEKRHDKAVMEVNKEMNSRSLNWKLVITWLVCLIISIAFVVGFYWLLWN